MVFTLSGTAGPTPKPKAIVQAVETGMKSSKLL